VAHFPSPKQLPIDLFKDIESATITLEDGSSYAADLVVGADGEKVC
jgi:2-polyprenyl-6-methoxyphenol hydroxylase-like FAD-dependent oxidoreductase